MSSGILSTCHSILVTGGTGSFGNAFVRYLLDHTPIPRICIYSRDEHKQEVMADTLGNPDRLRFFLGDVRDANHLKLALRGIDIVIHAAALKRVPALEYSPFEAIQTNVLGTQRIIEAAILSGSVRRVIALSTDKATNPCNLYGATKLCLEKLMIASQNLSGASGPRFACVRYGNVAGSRGSIIPKWRALLAQHRYASLPVTDPDATRFWITLDEAVALVVHALDNTRGGEVFIPKLPAFRLGDLATVMQPDAPPSVIGMRPGEKRHEWLIGPDELVNAYDVGACYQLAATPPNAYAVPVLPEVGYNSRDARRMDTGELAQQLSEVP